MPCDFLRSLSMRTVHRLRQLLTHLPGCRNRAPSKGLFLKRTESVEELRNNFQHLVGEISALTQADFPVLGSLTWLRPIDVERRTFSTWSFIPGRFRTLHPSSVVQLPTDVPTEITQIELWLADKGVNISSLRAAVADVVAALEESLQSSSLGPSTICDSLGCVVVEYLSADERLD
jgi:hypothetical protein